MARSSYPLVNANSPFTTRFELQTSQLNYSKGWLAALIISIGTYKQSKGILSLRYMKLVLTAGTHNWWSIYVVAIAI